MCKVLENKALSDEARMESLENQLKDARILAEEADKKYDDIAKKLQVGQRLLTLNTPVPIRSQKLSNFVPS